MPSRWPTMSPSTHMAKYPDGFANGELLFQHGTANGGSQLVWYFASSKQGKPVLPEAGNYIWPNLSPDGTKLPLGLEVNGIADVWVVDVVRHTKTRLTSGPLYSSFPIWWPDGKSIVYGSGLAA